MLDHNKHVQEAACSALATLEEQAGPELLPRLRVRTSAAPRAVRAAICCALCHAACCLPTTVGTWLPQEISIDRADYR